MVDILLKHDTIVKFWFWNFPVQEEGQIGEIEDVYIHPSYQYARAYNDIAVIKLRASKGNSISLSITFVSIRYLQALMFLYLMPRAPKS